MPEFFDYDPLKGLTRFFDYEEDTGLVRIHTQQDVDPLLKVTTEVANTGAADSGIKKGFFKYASIPPVVQLELRKKGIDIYSKDPAMIRRMDQEIETTYSRFKTTHKKAWRPK